MTHGRAAGFLLAFCREGRSVRGRGCRRGRRGRSKGDIHRLPGGRSPASETVSLPGGAVMEKEIYLGGEGNDVYRAQIPAGRVKGQGSNMGSLLHLPSFRGGRPVPQLPPGYLYHRPSLSPGMMKRAL